MYTDEDYFCVTLFSCKVPWKRLEHSGTREKHSSTKYVSCFLLHFFRALADTLISIFLVRGNAFTSILTWRIVARRLHRGKHKAVSNDHWMAKSKYQLTRRKTNVVGRFVCLDNTSGDLVICSWWVQPFGWNMQDNLQRLASQEFGHRFNSPSPLKIYIYTVFIRLTALGAY